MAQIDDVIAGFSDRKNVTEFLADPKGYVRSKGLNPDDPETAAAFELYGRQITESINAANKIFGAADVKNGWGIGAGCCNQKATARISQLKSGR